MGVARCSVGSGGRAAGAWPPWLPTALTLGDGGMARPSLGVLPPALLEPGMGGRSMGAGEGIWGTELDFAMAAEVEESG